jgi:hypothetical protein
VVDRVFPDDAVQNRVLYIILLSFLGAALLLILGAVVVFVLNGNDIPEGFLTIGATIVGGFLGVLVATPTKKVQ